MVAERGGARRVRTTIVVTAVVLAFAVGAGVLVAHSSGERLAGQTVSGSLPGTSPAADELAKAQSLEQQGKALEALQQYDAVLRVDPRNAEALADEGWLLARLRVAPDKAQERLDAAIAADPGYALAYYYRAAFRYDARHDANGAIADLRSFLGANPPTELVSQAQDLLGQLLCETHQAPADFNCGSAPSTTAPSSTTTKP
jgi:hypothetical protein